MSEKAETLYSLELVRKRQVEVNESIAKLKQEKYELEVTERQLQRLIAQAHGGIH